MSAYCDRDDIEARFGDDNVDTWATLADGDLAATKTARINTAIAVASDELDEILRAASGGYESKLPISTVPESVTDKVAIRAGLWLYSFRAADDYGDRATYLEKLNEQYNQWLADVRQGIRKLVLP